ncbi:MAG: glycosyltransferase [Euryarchaeota archaeon]|nr:glycosyltransferase [Euryarchaeota archaeon]
MKIAFGVCSLGIGHATRSFPVIRGLLKEGHEVVLISHGRALTVLKNEFPHLKFYDVEDFPIRYTEKAHQFFPYFIANSHKVIKNMIETHRLFLNIDKKENFDLIISDSRYDVFNRFKPSYIIIHQLRIMLKLALLRGGTMLYNHYMTKFFKKVLVPDFKENGISGEMAHNLRFILPEKVEYVGILSSFRRREVPRDIDTLISISGPEPQRTLFEKKVLGELDTLSGKVVVTLGKPDEKVQSTEAEIYPYVDFETREMLMNRAKVIISRSGYSTIMDMYVTGGKATFVPTPGQPEQRYLARFLNAQGLTGYAEQESTAVADMVKEAERFRGFKGGYDVKKTLDRIWEVVL